MERLERYVIRSLKHDGRLHRVWLENWKIPDKALPAAWTLSEPPMTVFVNEQTPIVEADGHERISRVPSVVYFMDNCWYNVVCLLENGGRVRYYCNLSSPARKTEGEVVYVDYDLDVLVDENGEAHVLDEDEFERHRRQFRYGADVERNVRLGLNELLGRIRARDKPFSDEICRRVYSWWRERGRTP